MSSEQEQVRLIAERIARRLSQRHEQKVETGDSAGQLNDEMATVRASLTDLQRRLARVESNLTQEDVDNSHAHASSAATHREPSTSNEPGEPVPARPTHSPWLSGMYVPAAHPSQEQFGVEEAVVSELVDFFENEKTCSIEPGAKPCDHCAMCSSRGF